MDLVEMLLFSLYCVAVMKGGEAAFSIHDTNGDWPPSLTVMKTTGKAKLVLLLLQHLLLISANVTTITAFQVDNQQRCKAWMVPEGVKFSTLDKLKFLNDEEKCQEQQQQNNSSDISNSIGGGNDGMVTVATKAVGLNFADIFTILGLYSAANEVRKKSKTLSPFIPGLEFSGIVLEGNGDSDGNVDANDDGDGNCGGSSGVNINDTVYKRGDRVLGFTRFGAYADIVNAPPQFLKRLPDSWSFAQGASFIVQALTAWHGLVEIGRMPIVVPVDCNDNDEKETEEEMKKTKTRKTKEKPFVVIVHSAAGGVGIWASEIAARRGGTVIGIVGNEAKANVFYDRIKQFSPNSQVMIRGEERDFHQRLAKTLQSIHSHSISVDDKISFEISKSKLNNMDLKEMAKEGYGADIVMESLGGRYFQASFDSINDGGALVTFGSTSYVTPGLGLNLLRLVYRYITRPRVDPGSLTSRNIRLCGFNLIYLTQKTSELRRELNECISCLSGLDECHQTNEDVPLDNIIPPIIGEAFDF